MGGGLRRVPQLAAYILKLEQKLRGIIDWGDDDAHDARAAWLQRVRPVPCHFGRLASACRAHHSCQTPQSCVMP